MKAVFLFFSPSPFGFCCVPVRFHPPQLGGAPSSILGLHLASYSVAFGDLHRRPSSGSDQLVPVFGGTTGHLMSLRNWGSAFIVHRSLNESGSYICSFSPGLLRSFAAAIPQQVGGSRKTAPEGERRRWRPPAPLLPAPTSYVHTQFCEMDPDPSLIQTSEQEATIAMHLLLAASCYS